MHIADANTNDRIDNATHPRDGAFDVVAASFQRTNGVVPGDAHVGHKRDQLLSKRAYTGTLSGSRGGSGGMPEERT